MLVEEKEVSETLGKVMITSSSLYTEPGVYPPVVHESMVDSGRSLRRPISSRRYNYENPLNLEIYWKN